MSPQGVSRQPRPITRCQVAQQAGNSFCKGSSSRRPGGPPEQPAVRLVGQWRRRSQDAGGRAGPQRCLGKSHLCKSCGTAGPASSRVPPWTEPDCPLPSQPRGSASSTTCSGHAPPEAKGSDGGSPILLRVLPDLTASVLPPGAHDPRSQMLPGSLTVCPRLGLFSPLPKLVRSPP